MNLIYYGTEGRRILVHEHWVHTQKEDIFIRTVQTETRVHTYLLELVNGQNSNANITGKNVNIVGKSVFQ